MPLLRPLKTARAQLPQSYLLTSVLRMHLGNLAALVVLVLISSGRMTAKQLATATEITPKTIKTTLVSLIQLRCVQYWREEPSGKVFYSFLDEGVWVLLLAGEIINCIRTQYGEDEAEIIQNILEMGNVKVGDYLASFSGEKRHQRATILTRLFAEKWLQRLQPVDFQPLLDIWAATYEETSRSIPRNNTTSEIKRVAEAKELTRRKITDLFAAANNPATVYTTVDGIRTLDPKITIAFSLPRYEKHARSETLFQLARHKVGTLTAQVYQAALKLVESNSPDIRSPFLSISGWCNDPDDAAAFKNGIENKLVDDKKITFGVRDVARVLPTKLDLSNSILTHNFLVPAKRTLHAENGTPTKKVKLEDGSMDIFLTQEPAKNNNQSLSLILHHLKTLCSSLTQFLHETSPSTFTVPYGALAQELKKHYYDQLIKATLGPEALRVLRALKKLNLADEKALSSAVLLKEKALRNELYNMVKLNIVEIQEVPRSADRAASKTFFLFRHREQMAYDFLIQSITFSMAELLQNIDDFKQQHRILLAKCEREDVKGNEEALLLASELKTLKSLQHREIVSIGRFNRLKILRLVFNA